MTSREIRQKFLQFFKAKNHIIVASAPIVLKNDPTLMFTNAGMNQFKDIFLGEQKPAGLRIADTQKCLRVSGKHNDLEEVGHDTYHHTMFEMLGNWSFGDYFKKEAIAWAWELLTNEFKIDPGRLYATVFGGEQEDGLEADKEAIEFWKSHLPDDRILAFGKKDNFWEMGDTGPCGPCSEIHIDLRNDEERQQSDGRKLVNTGSPDVIELWNLVFIQYNRKTNGELAPLPQVHVDTGMGFERLCMVLQGKQSTYDTDIFKDIFSAISNRSGKSYSQSVETDIAMRVIADHLRAITFTIADGQLPSNTGAGYVVRRILRRAVRYAYSFLGIKAPFLHEMISVLSLVYEDVFPELARQQAFIEKVVKEEESNFLKTLENGLSRLDEAEGMLEKGDRIPGKVIFELYDTYGFPIDLTRLVSNEKGFGIDEKGFEAEMAIQKARSRDAGQTETGDWIETGQHGDVKFVGYDTLESETYIIKHRSVQKKDKQQFQIVLAKTPFYAESGGQTGDTGRLIVGDETIDVLDTRKENDLIVHTTSKIPTNVKGTVKATVDTDRRNMIVSNHSATHLLHAALRKELGTHVEQKGSYVGPEHLRFDFSHFEKVVPEQLQAIELLVNQMIWANTKRETHTEMPMKEALEMGAMALFGEKYGETVRVVTFDPTFSVELCGGTHVESTGQIGLFKIVSESAIAAGVRRIEAVTGKGAYDWVQRKIEQLAHIGSLTRSNKDHVKAVESLLAENQNLKNELQALSGLQVNQLKSKLIAEAEEMDGCAVINGIVEISSSDALKNLVFDLKKNSNTIVILGAEIKSKPILTIAINDKLVEEKGWHAGQLVKAASAAIKGGGGGQAFYATAGGHDTSGLQKAIEIVKGKLF